jgi:hypothetical protein
MTTATPIKTNTIYTVCLGFCACDGWEDDTNEDGSTNYDNQPTTSRTVTVVLPSGATPFDVYCRADGLIDLTEVEGELSAEGGMGVDGDGCSITFDGREYTVPYDSILSTTSWDEFEMSVVR